MQSYTICFLFNQNLDKVWLLKKLKGPYAGRMNGIGGAILESENPVDAVLRKIKDEASLSQVEHLQYIGSLQLPAMGPVSVPAVPGQALPEECALHYFAAILPEGCLPIAPDGKETVVPHETEYIVNRTPHDRYLAGEGDIPYFMNLALARLMNRDRSKKA